MKKYLLFGLKKETFKYWIVINVVCCQMLLKTINNLRQVVELKKIWSIHLLTALLGPTSGWTPFWLQNHLDSSLHRFNRALILVHIDITASSSCCKLVSWSSMMQTPFNLISKLLVWTVTSSQFNNSVSWTHWHVQQTSVRLFELLSC